MVDLTYTLREHGWATIRAVLEGTELDFQVSYMSSALEDLVSSVCAVANGQPVVRFALIDEPGEYCWTIRRDGDICNIEIVHLERMWITEHYNSRARAGQKPPEEEGAHVASLTCRATDLIAATDRMLKEIENRYPEAEFVRTQNPKVSAATATRLRELCGKHSEQLSRPA